MPLYFVVINSLKIIDLIKWWRLIWTISHDKNNVLYLNLITKIYLYLISSEAYVYIWVPVQAGISLYLLYGLLGNSMFAGLAVLAVSGPTTVLMSRFSHSFRRAIMKIKDKRIKIINETLNAIKVR